MSRFCRLLCPAILLVALGASAALADGADGADPLDALKVVAKAKFEAARPTPAERARALKATAQDGLLARFQDYRAGKITPNSLLAWSPLLLEAELASLDKDADPAPAYERHWRDMRELEAIAEVKLWTGKIAVSDVAEARCARLQAELDWLSHRGAGGKAPHGTAALDTLGEWRNAARDQREAIQADPRRLKQERLSAAREALRAWIQEFQTGKITPNLVLQGTRWVFDAEVALFDKDADRTPFFERRWKTLWQIEEMAKTKLRAGKISAYDLASCRSICLEAEIAWTRARKEAERPGGRMRSAPAAEDDANWARVKWQGAHADIGTLLRERLQAAREAWRAADLDFLAGKVTPEAPLEASFRLLEADQAAAEPKEEAAALEKYWERTLKLEAVAEIKLRAAKIAVADVLEVRFARLEAEMWMAAGRVGWEPVWPFADQDVPG